MPTKKTVDLWMSELHPELRQVAEAPRRLILESEPKLTEAIKWGNPVYEMNGKVCYLAATNAYVTLGFFNGASLNNAQTQMEGTGKNMRHVKVPSLQDIRRELYTSWVREAVVLNEHGQA